MAIRELVRIITQKVICSNVVFIMYEAFNLPSTCYNKPTWCHTSRLVSSHNKSTFHDKPFTRQHGNKRALNRI